MERTGGGGVSIKKLSKIEDRLLSIIDVTAIEGDIDLGLPTCNEEPINILIADIEYMIDAIYKA